MGFEFDSEKTFAIVEAERKALVIDGKKLSQKELANKLYMSDSNYKHSKLNSLTAQQLVILCDLFNCDPAYILGMQKEKTKAETDIRNEIGLDTEAIDVLRCLNKYHCLPSAFEMADTMGINVELLLKEDNEKDDDISLINHLIGCFDYDALRKASGYFSACSRISYIKHHPKHETIERIMNDDYADKDIRLLFNNLDAYDIKDSFYVYDENGKAEAERFQLMKWFDNCLESFIEKVSPERRMLEREFDADNEHITNLEVIKDDEIGAALLNQAQENEKLSIEEWEASKGR